MNYKKFIRPNKEITSIAQLLMPLAFYLGYASGAEWYWWILAFFFYFLYLCIGNNLALHRYFCHGHFTVSRPVEWFFVWTSAMSMMGTPLSWSTTHMHHHIHSDTKQDIHGPVIGFKTLLFYFYSLVEIDERVFNSPRFKYLYERYNWLTQNYWYFIIANLILMALIGYKVFLFCWFIPATFSLWIISFSIYMQHWPNGASNNRYYTLIGLGESLHYNHHVKPGVSNTAFNPGEFDYMHWIAKLFAKRFNNES